MASSSGFTSVWRCDKPLHAVLQHEATDDTVLLGTVSLLCSCFFLEYEEFKAVFTFVLQVESRCGYRPKRRTVAGMWWKVIGSRAYRTFQTDRQTERLRSSSQKRRCVCVRIKKKDQKEEKEEELKSLTGRCYNIKLFSLEER